MNCPNIGEIKFSTRSLDAIEEIKRIKQFSNMLASAMSGGVVVNIFLGNDLTKASYSLYSTDFEVFSQAMMAVPKVTRKLIENAADRAWLDTSNHKEQQFWRAISNGCSIH